MNSLEECAAVHTQQALPPGSKRDVNACEWDTRGPFEMDVNDSSSVKDV